MEAQDYLAHKLFGAALHADPDQGGRLRAEPVPADPLRIVYCPNDFPYNLAPGIRHDVLWATQRLDDGRVDEEIRRNIPASHEYIWYENPPGLKTIPGLWHVQVMHRPRPDVA